MKAIIPTGGRGTRMRPLTFSANKHFIPVANKPLIFYPIETVIAAGITDIAITYNDGYLDEVKSILGDGSKWGARFTYVLQEKPLGLANIFQVCENFLAGESFVLHLGDNIFADGITEAVDYFQTNKPTGLVLMVHHKENSRLGVPYFDDNGRLVQYVEKPENPPHDFAIPGIYFFDNTVFKCFREDPIQPSERGELEIPSPYQWLIDHNYRVDVLEYKGEWLDPGKFDDWIEANRYILENKLETKIECEVGGDTTIEGRVVIGKNCEIRDSEIKGPVIIGDNVKIINSYIGPYSAISNNCAIENSAVENSVIMNDVKIKNTRKQPITTSLIGTDSEIIGEDGPAPQLKLFVGEKCRIEI